MDTIRLANNSPDAGTRAVREILLAATSLDFSKSPPSLSGELQAQLREITGCDDPFREAKQGFNKLALELLPPLAKAVAQSTTPFELAVRLAIAGNVIDLGAKSGLSEEEVRNSATTALDQPLLGDVQFLCDTARAAKKILYLADNAGEIVFDRVLIEQLPPKSVTVAVRGRPILNDATREDAAIAGLLSVATVIDNGSGAPGTLLDDCSPAFKKHFFDADIIIAKGQGNFESLHDTAAPLFFLFRVKCPIVAKHCGYPVGSHVVWKSPSFTSKMDPANNESLA